MSNEIQKPAEHKKSLMTTFANKYNVEPEKMHVTLKATAFRQKNGQEVTNEQMMALVLVANEYGLNPFTKEIYAFPDRNAGIIPIVGVDGWSRIINQHPQFDGMEFESGPLSEPLDQHHKPCPEWIKCTVYRKDRGQTISITEYLDEVYREPFIKNGNPIKGPWQSHTKRFLRHKAMIQCARIAFGFTGIYDPDEGERVIEGQVIHDAPARPETEEYSQESLEKNLEKWAALIESGKKTADDIIDAIEARAILTIDQKQIIRDCATIAGGE